ncbi:DUF4173 domain-containing protein [Lewinella sp. 4G2]|uniref:DUF4153 domain-containing protein n=1 Tax=Lewinella sp. 4G2 TaxID=1803372 RepID=UPI0007B4AE71|nr:DUF4173 domain-containing protein [Lewinella sp. 4G2]OAV44287.1 hypothetical protein A3850_007165 [Lewinella sp. 4G2]
MDHNFEIQSTTQGETAAIAPSLSKSLIATLGLAASYAFLFFHYELGLNVLIFDTLLLLTALRLRPDLPKYRSFPWVTGGLLFSAVAVVIVNSPASLVAHHISLLLFVGCVQARELRFIWFGLLLGCFHLTAGLLPRLKKFHSNHDASWTTRFYRQLGPVLAALIIATPFFLFYLLGNAALGDLFGEISLYFSDVELSSTLLPTLLLMLLGAVIATATLVKTRKSSLVDLQAGFTDELAPHQSDFEVLLPPFRTYKKLKREARLAISTLAILNVLLLTVNLADLRYVWLSTDELTAATLSQYVHAGTTHLIASIFLAMGVILYFFRGSLNFLATPGLKPLAVAWVAQNFLLLLSVGLRNYHYVDAYGLAIGRIYVFIALLILAFGLLTLYRKVTQQLSLTYLLHSNGMALWLSLLLFGAINWAGVITRYNLSTQDTTEIDWDYLYYGFGGRNDFLLYTHPKAIAVDVVGDKRRYTSTYRYADWRSWNYAQYRVNQMVPHPNVWR